MKGLGKLTYELPSINILDIVTLEHQHTRPTIENTMHIHTCAYFSPLLYIYIYTHTHTNTHTLKIDK